MAEVVRKNDSTTYLDHKNEFNKLRAEMIEYSNEMNKLAHGVPFEEIDFANMWTHIPIGDSKRMYELGSKIAQYNLRMREIIKLERS